jgi:hypothetical protein
MLVPGASSTCPKALAILSSCVSFGRNPSVLKPLYPALNEAFS